MNIEPTFGSAKYGITSLVYFFSNLSLLKLKNNMLPHA
jgi:hypothetical protein